LHFDVFEGTLPFIDSVCYAMNAIDLSIDNRNSETAVRWIKAKSTKSEVLWAGTFRYEATVVHFA
jgi:hypothetical protein